MTIKKSAHPRTLPGIHPGLEQRIRDAEEAELKGETPRSLDEAQKVLRPTIETTVPERKAQVRTIGLVDPVYRTTSDGLAALAEQDAFMPGVNLDEVWDSLSEGDKIRAGAIERFRLEMENSLRIAAMPWDAPHKLGGRLDARNLGRGTRNLRAEIDAYAYLLAPDSLDLLRRFFDETQELLELCLRQKAVQGIESTTMHDLLRDLLHKLIYQELASRRRAMGDRGIRRICGNIDLAEQVYAKLKAVRGYTPRERLLMRIIHVHQDLGNTAYAARVSFRGGRLHRAYGARIFTDEMNRYRCIIGQKELEMARTAVATHSFDELPFAEARVLALIRAVDHLAPFAPHRVYKQLEQVDGVADYLDDLLERARDKDLERYDAAKHALAQLLADRELPPPLRDDIMAAFRAFERKAELIDLGELAGSVDTLVFPVAEPGKLDVSLRPDPFAQRYQALFDVQQDQLLRLARSSNVSLEQLMASPQLTLGVGGTINIQR